MKKMLVALLVPVFIITMLAAPAEAGFKSKMKKLGHDVKVGAEYSVVAVLAAIYIYSRGN
jgi:hypothetical protein